MKLIQRRILFNNEKKALMRRLFLKHKKLEKEN